MSPYRQPAPKPKIVTVGVTLCEDVSASDWTISWDHATIPEAVRAELGCEGAPHLGLCCEREPTAAEAQRSVLRTLAAMADRGVSTAAVLTWIPSTRIGAMVVRGLQ